MKKILYLSQGENKSLVMMVFTARLFQQMKNSLERGENSCSAAQAATNATVNDVLPPSGQLMSRGLPTMQCTCTKMMYLSCTSCYFNPIFSAERLNTLQNKSLCAVSDVD